MKFQTLVETLSNLEFKPLSVHPLKERASWMFSNLNEQYSFVIFLTNLLQGYFYMPAEHLEGEGGVQQIDYLYLKDYEGYEISVYHDFKVELCTFKY